MKIAIGSKILNKAWGGGNLFVKNLSKHLINNGHEVIFDLFDNDIDVILFTDPRFSSENSTFNHKDIKYFQKLVNPNVKVVHRVNECDQRKDTFGVNEYYLLANKVADHTVFVSKWLQTIYINEGFESSESSVIMSGSDNKIFNNKNYKEWKKGDKFKLITHHWGNNKNKGFALYSQLDNLLDNKFWKDKISFEFIGNTNPEYEFKNTKITSPLYEESLAQALKECNAYITASINEPSGNHHIESSQCGLPLLYIKSGGIPEFAEDHGLEYNLQNLEEKLLDLMDNYSYYFDLMKSYPFNSEIMSKDYEDLFLRLGTEKKIKIKFSIVKIIIFKIFYKIRYFVKFNPVGNLIFKSYLRASLIISKNKHTI
tara:strand:- start:52 stop:1161 length:1110 start_codon:yes stop_codon:yes gene_type:complete